jgi:K+-sensing histidine kinase KdpD
VSYGIVQAHGGELRVESTPGLGTTMEIVLPPFPTGAAEPEPLGGSAAAAAASAEGRG